MRTLIYVLVALSSLSANAQYNSRNWVNIPQVMVGGQPSVTSTPFSAFNSLWPFKYYSLEVNPRGVTTSPWTVLLEGSNDSALWTTITSVNSGAAPSGGYAFQSSAEPVLYLRVRGSVIGNGDIITATAIGVP